MDKKWNKWLIICGILVPVAFGFIPGMTYLSKWLFVPGIIIAWFGILNYQEWRTWVKIVLSVVLAILSILLLIAIILRTTNFSGVWS